MQNESFSTAMQAEAAAFASEPLDESKFSHSGPGYEFLQMDKRRDKYAAPVFLVHTKSKGSVTVIFFAK